MCLGLLKGIERKEVAVENSFEQANLFELGGYSTQVTYSSTSITGQPLLNYRDDANNLNFMGDEIRIVEAEIGQLITVTLESGAADAPPVTFTLVLPEVNVLPQSGGTQIQVPGILTTTRSLFGGPRLGAEKTYFIIELQGTAQFVQF
jgi:hypothetical protein